MTSIVIAAATALVLQVASPERQKELLAEIHAKTRRLLSRRHRPRPCRRARRRPRRSRPVVQSSSRRGGLPPS